MGDRIRAVLFDLDGTLLDTLADIAHAMNTVLRAEGMPEHPVEAYRKMVGSGFRVLTSRAVPPELAGDTARLARIVEAFRAEYERDPIRFTRPYDGVEPSIDELVRRGIPLGVLSNKADAPVRSIVAIFFEEIPFRVVAGLRDGVPAKPDPASALAAAAQIGVEPHHVAFIGDSDIDVATARNAGMVAVGAAWGFRGEAELVEAGADVIVRHPRDIVAVLDTMEMQ